MDSKKKSALTAALSAPDGEVGQSDKGTLPRDDISSFPCLSEDQKQAKTGELAKQFSNVSLEGKNSFVGSAPTAGLSPGVMVGLLGSTCYTNSRSNLTVRYKGIQILNLLLDMVTYRISSSIDSICEAEEKVFQRLW